MDNCYSFEPTSSFTVNIVPNRCQLLSSSQPTILIIAITILIINHLVFLYDDAHDVGRQNPNRDCELIYRPKPAATEGEEEEEDTKNRGHTN